jgi:hypothetical protein
VLEPGPSSELHRWIATRVETGTTVRRLSHQDYTTTNGWPVELITYSVDGALILLAVYVFFDLAAAVAVRGLDPAKIADEEQPLITALLAADPDWQTDEPRAIIELWREPSDR